MYSRKKLPAIYALWAIAFSLILTVAISPSAQARGLAYPFPPTRLQATALTLTQASSSKYWDEVSPAYKKSTWYFAADGTLKIERPNTPLVYSQHKVLTGRWYFQADGSIFFYASASEFIDSTRNDVYEMVNVSGKIIRQADGTYLANAGQSSSRAVVSFYCWYICQSDVEMQPWVTFNIGLR